MASGERREEATGEYQFERALRTANRLEAEARFWEEHAAGLWTAYAAMNYSPRFLWQSFTHAKHLRFDRFREMLVAAGVKFAPRADEYVSYQVKPNFKSLGRRLGKKMKATQQALMAADADKLKRALEKDGQVSVSVDGDRNEHQYRMRLDVLDALRASDRSILSCGLFDGPSSPNGRIPFDLYQTNVFFATPVTNPSQFVLDVQCRVDGETTPVGALPIKVQLPPTSNSVALGAVDADTMILVGGLGWIGAVTPPMASQLRLVTDTLTLAEPASSTGDADAILPLLEDVGSLSPLSNDYNAEKCGIFERIADQVDETLPTNVADACDAL